jgi:hypothetical protein
MYVVFIGERAGVSGLWWCVVMGKKKIFFWVRIAGWIEGLDGWVVDEWEKRAIGVIAEDE